MTDSSMTNILKNFNNAEGGKGKVIDAITGKTKISDAANQNNAMKILLEGLDSAQRSVNQMPAPHTMAKNTATKHPASKFLVGGEYEDEPNADELDHRWDQENMTGVVTAKLKDVVQDEEPLEEGSLRSVKVTFSDGNTITTDMAANLSDEQIQDYYQVGKRFNLGDGAGGDNVVTVSNVEVLDNARDKRRQQAMGHQSMGSVDLDNQNADLRDDVSEGFDSPKSVAIELKSMYDNDPVQQQIIGKSPEFYRALMYSFYPGAGEIDGSKQFHDIVDELEGLFTGVRPPTTIPEAAGGDNFTADDLQRLGTITDLEQLKQAAAGLISNTDSKRPMKPEKVSWFLNRIAEKSTVASVIKMMWDLLLAGEGSAVIGSKGSTKKSSYRDRFGEDTIGKRKASSDVHKKQSLADIFHSMDETEEDKAAQFKKELHSDRKARELNRGDNGKFNLAEDRNSDMQELMAIAKRLDLFTSDISDVEEEFRVNNGDTYVALAKKIVEAVSNIRQTSETTESNQTRSQLNKMVHRNQTK